MKHEVFVNFGEVEACRENGVLRASAIGSCVVVTGYDVDFCVGGMAHVMLPGASRAPNPSDRTKYAEDAIQEMMRKMEALGAKAARLSVCLVGGGNVLSDGHDSLGPEIVQSLIAILGEKGIAPVAMEVGGTQRRSCSLDVSCGRVTYTIGDSVERMLWEAAAHRIAPGHGGHPGLPEEATS